MSPRVSVLVPSYNNAEFIEETIDSILGQSFGDFELIVADHTSTDQTWPLLQPYAVDPRVTLLQTPAGGGAPANWSRVTAAATGEYVKLVCGDDLIDPECLANQVAVMEANPGVVLSSCQRDLIDAHGKKVTSARGLAGLDGVVPGGAAARRAVIVGSNIFGEPACNLMRREALENIGGWADSEPYVIDQQTFCNLLMTGDFYALPKSLASFRLSSSQWSVDLAKQQSDQVVAFHHRLAADNPGLLSRIDLVRGDTMARAMAYVRRAAYLWLGRKMTPPEAVPAEAPL
ncbi:MAG: glycosyltransferase family 2 protein [Terracoccus sp.]